MIKGNKIKRWSTVVSIVMVISILITGCSMSNTARELLQRNKSNSWSADFKYLDGDLAHSFKKKDGKPSIIYTNSSIQSGSLTLQVQLQDKIEEIPIGKKEVDLSSWDDGEFILRIVADDAQDGSVVFTWE